MDVAEVVRPPSRWSGSDRHWASKVFLAGWLCAFGFGCNQILGIEQAELDPQGSGGSSATGGDTGSGGTPGSGGNVGVCEDYATGDVELVRGCLLRMACDPLVPYYTMSDCVTYAYQLVNAHEACTYGARTCADIEECLGRRMIPSESCSDVSGWSCNEGEAVLCGVSVPYAYDCTAGAQGCVMPLDFPVDGDTAPCLADAEACTDEPGALHCDGDVLYECINGARYGRSCAAAAGTCVEDTPGQAGCIDSTTHCNMPGTITCNGNVLTYCGESGLRSVLDCSTAGLRCESDGAYADCVAPSCTIEDVASCSEGCNGTRVRYCVGGSPTEVDCTDFGFTECVEGVDAGVSFAYCAGDGAAPGADSCRFANDDECDEPSLCDPGTDTTDCTNFPLPVD